MILFDEIVSEHRIHYGRVHWEDERDISEQLGALWLPLEQKCVNPDCEEIIARKFQSKVLLNQCTPVHNLMKLKSDI